jgi:hypothetical protein
VWVSTLREHREKVTTEKNGETNWPCKGNVFKANLGLYSKQTFKIEKTSNFQNVTLHHCLPFPLPQTGLCYAAQAGLELIILLPQPPKRCDYRHVPPCLASVCLFVGGYK